MSESSIYLTGCWQQFFPVLNDLIKYQFFEKIPKQSFVNLKKKWKHRNIMLLVKKNYFSCFTKLQIKKLKQMLVQTSTVTSVIRWYFGVVCSPQLKCQPVQLCLNTLEQFQRRYPVVFATAAPFVLFLNSLELFCGFPMTT